jgi:hypothetical protein
MFGAVRGFELKLKMFRKQMEDVNVCFSSCNLFHKDGSANVSFPSALAAEIIDSLVENFNMRFNDFRSHATNIRIIEKPFSVEVSDAPEGLQL